MEGWKELRLKKALGQYREGNISLDKAAEDAGINVSQMMQEAAARGIKSEETVEDFRRSLKILE